MFISAEQHVYPISAKLKPEIITRKNRHHMLLKISRCQSYQTQLLSLPKMTRSHAVSSFKSRIFDKSSHMSFRISPPLN